MRYTVSTMSKNNLFMKIVNFITPGFHQITIASKYGNLMCYIRYDMCDMYFILDESVQIVPQSDQDLVTRLKCIDITKPDILLLLSLCISHLTSYPNLIIINIRGVKYIRRKETGLFWSSTLTIQSSVFMVHKQHKYWF